ncbi:MAG TPA: hypothetical protein DCZ01_04615, partial [Elusimicrobia bacterium]|nr:hypothetical protein [Elusimicrobiota bacterium]
MPEKRPELDHAILWVTHPSLLWQRVGGLRVVERQLFTAARAGIRTVWVGMQTPEPETLADLRLPPGLEVRWITKGEASLKECAPPYLGISADHFVRVETLAHIARQCYPESVSFEDASGLGVVQVVLAREETVSRRKLPLPPGSFRRLEAPLAADETIEWLMLAGPKSQDGFMARNFDRHISLAVSSRLLDT